MLSAPGMDDDVAYLVYIGLDYFGHLTAADEAQINALLKRGGPGAARFFHVFNQQRGAEPKSALSPETFAALATLHPDLVGARQEELTGFFAERPTSATKRVLAFCRAACPEAVSGCVGDAVMLAGGYDALWSFGSPAPMIVDEDRYRESPRFTGDFARMLRHKAPPAASGLGIALKRKSCAARFAYGE